MIREMHAENPEKRYRKARDRGPHRLIDTHPETRLHCIHRILR
jgi:hypothetical protein